MAEVGKFLVFALFVFSLIFFLGEKNQQVTPAVGKPLKKEAPIVIIIKQEPVKEVKTIVIRQPAIREIRTIFINNAPAVNNVPVACNSAKPTTGNALIKEWAPDIEELKKELAKVKL
jgi:hypothetical protein